MGSGNVGILGENGKRVPSGTNGDPIVVTDSGVDGLATEATLEQVFEELVDIHTNSNNAATETTLQDIANNITSLTTIATNTASEPQNTSTTAANITTGSKSVGTPGTPEALVGVSFLVQRVDIQASFMKAVNTNNAFVGINGDCKYILTPGSTYSINAPPGKKINLNTIYVDVTNGVTGGFFYIAYY